MEGASADASELDLEARVRRGNGAARRRAGRVLVARSGRGARAVAARPRGVVVVRAPDGVVEEQNDARARKVVPDAQRHARAARTALRRSVPVAELPGEITLVPHESDAVAEIRLARGGVGGEARGTRVRCAPPRLEESPTGAAGVVMAVASRWLLWLRWQWRLWRLCSGAVRTVAVVVAAVCVVAVAVVGVGVRAKWMRWQWRRRNRCCADVAAVCTVAVMVAAVCVAGYGLLAVWLRLDN